MFPILTLSIIFMLILAYYRRKGSKAQEEVQAHFWEQERVANSTRRQDISELEYISIPFDKLPLDADSEAAETIRSLADEKIMNLTAYTNTELKMKYGIANLEALTACDSNFVALEKALEAYSMELLKSDRSEDAKQILEYAISIGADVSSLYLMLANLYREQGLTDKLTWLIGEASKLQTLTKDSLVQRLTELASN